MLKFLQKLNMLLKVAWDSTCLGANALVNIGVEDRWLTNWCFHSDKLASNQLLAAYAEKFFS